MRRVGKILVCVVASLAAAFTTWHAAWFALVVWAYVGTTVFTEADVPQLAAMFAEATTLRDSKRSVQLGLARDTRLVVVPVDVKPSDADSIMAIRHARGIWSDLRFTGHVEEAEIRRSGDIPIDVAVALVDRDGKGPPEYLSASGITQDLGRPGCSIHLLLSPDQTQILKAETQVVAGTLPPYWRPVMEPCVTRGLFASVGLVGDSCIIRPSVLCGKDSRSQGATVDYFLLRVLHASRKSQAATPAAIEQLLRELLSRQPENGGFNAEADRLGRERSLLNIRIKDRFYTHEEIASHVLEGRQTWWERWLLL